MYGKLQEYVSARINAALRTGTRSARYVIHCRRRLLLWIPSSVMTDLVSVSSLVLSLVCG